MKKKIAIILICLFLLSILNGCNNKVNNNTSTNSSQSSTSIESSSEISSEDMAYYFKAYTYIQEFYKGFYYISDSIEDVDKNLFDVYLTMMNDAKESINTMNVPSKYLDAHDYLKKAIDEYISATNDLYYSYNECSLDKYLESTYSLENASSTLEAYVTLVSNDFNDISVLFSSLLQNEYYMNYISIYSYQENFTEDENKSLFELERYIKKFANLKDDLLFAVCQKDNVSTYKKAFNKNLENIKNVSISNQNILNYRNEIVKYIEKYCEIVNILSENLEKDYDKKVIKNLIEESENLNYYIYLSLSHISEFYKSYNIDIGFDNSIENIESLIDSIMKEEQK